MIYSIDKKKTVEAVRRRLSRAGAKLLLKDGTPAYDIVWPTSQDDMTLMGYLEDSISTLVARFRLATASSTDMGDTVAFSADVPDLDETVRPAFDQSVQAFLETSVCTMWLQKVMPESSEPFSVQADTAMKKAVSLLYSRKRARR